MQCLSGRDAKNGFGRGRSQSPFENISGQSSSCFRPRNTTGQPVRQENAALRLSHRASWNEEMIERNSTNGKPALRQA
jgi:hypothetical protein